MTYIILFILVILIGLYYSFKHGNNAKKEIQDLTQKIIIDDTNSMLLWEEDYLMVEIMSSNNIDYANGEIDGTPETNKNKQFKTKDLNISKSEFGNLLRISGLKEYEKITYVGAGEPQVLKNSKTKAFGSLSSAILFDGKTDKIEHIWLSSHNWNEINKTNILNGLNAIGKQYGMILLDNYPIQNKLVDLKNINEIQDYIDIYVERFNEG